MAIADRHTSSSSTDAVSGRLDRPVDDLYDHALGPPNAPITLVEYGSYDCPHCRAANERITEVRRRLGDRLRYVYRHRPISELARRAAEIVETARDPDEFWDAHVTLMTRSERLTEEDLRVVAERIGLDDGPHAMERIERAEARVERDVASADASGVRFTPTFFVNGRRYDGAWDETSFTDALLGTLGYRVRVAALNFASWAPAAGMLLLIATVAALLVSNSPLRGAFAELWSTELGFRFGGVGYAMPLADWVNDGLLTLFFLVVGLEIKRELTVGHLANLRAAALPIAAAIGGMALPAIVYLAVIPDGAFSRGAGVPIATDTAFAIAVIAMLGRRVPVELRIFLTAAAIVDDVGALTVVALFYSGALEPAFLGGAAFVTVVLALLNRSGVYRLSPYLLVGAALWACVHAGGLHATLAGVVLAALIPTRPPPDYGTLALQADSVLTHEARHGGERLRLGPSEPALRALDAIHDRLLSPAERLLRSATPRSTLVVLPLFALANAGVELSDTVLEGHERLQLAIIGGLFVGKPVGFVLLAALAVRLGVATKPAAFSWRQLTGAGAIAGIGFTMSLFIAAQAFPAPSDFAAAKIAVFAGSLASVALGIGILWGGGAAAERPSATPPSCTVVDPAAASRYSAVRPRVGRGDNSRQREL